MAIARPDVLRFGYATSFLDPDWALGTGAEFEFALDQLLTILEAHNERRLRDEAEFSLRLALHLTPRVAFELEPEDPWSRWELIRDHNQERLDFLSAAELESVARSVAVTIDAILTTRDSVTGWASLLYRRQGGRCATCRVAVYLPDQGTSPNPASVRNLDPYKPTHHRSPELVTGEVDHITPVSLGGTNTIENLQLLCRFCNSGKGQSLGVTITDELKFAADEVATVPVSHRAAMAYLTFANDRFRCRLCQSIDAELSVRPVDEAGLYVRSNVFAVCAECLYGHA